MAKSRIPNHFRAGRDSWKSARLVAPSTLSPWTRKLMGDAAVSAASSVKVLSCTPRHATLSVPSSKSQTIRAMLLAAVASGESIIENVLKSDDTYWCFKALETLSVHCEWLDEGVLRVCGKGGNLLQAGKDYELYLGASGITARFLLALLSAERAQKDSCITMFGDDSLNSRDMGVLCVYLQKLAHLKNSPYKYLEDEGRLPVAFSPFGLLGGELQQKVRALESSQFMSAILMAAPFAKKPVHVSVLKPSPYVALTCQSMQIFGGDVESIAKDNGGCEIRVAPGCYRGGRLEMEVDMSSACYGFAFAALHQVSVVITGLVVDTLQADGNFLQVLKKLGCKIENLSCTSRGACTSRGEGGDISGNGDISGDVNGIRCTGARELRGGFQVDMSDMPDQILTLGCLALFADAPVVMTGSLLVASDHECDRLQALENNIALLGGKIERDTEGRWLKVYPLDKASSVFRGEDVVMLESYEDHRVVMSFMVLSTRLKSVVLNKPFAVAKTFPQFFAMLEILGCELRYSG